MSPLLLLDPAKSSDRAVLWRDDEALETSGRLFLMDAQRLFDRYRELQSYVGWTEADAQRMQQIGPLLAPHFPDLVEDFYSEIERHPDARKVITGGAEQVSRLKGTLVLWLQQLVSGQYDADYVFRRWKIGYRHVEIGLDQVFTNVALSRLRRGLLRLLDQCWTGPDPEPQEIRGILNTLLDLDLALIEDAYQTEYLLRQRAAERLALIGQVAGGIAHELRNPLNVVKTSVYYLLNARNPSPEKAASHLERIGRQVEHAEEVIAALVRFAKMSLPDLRSIEISEVIHSALQAIEPPANVRTAHVCPDGLRVVADGDQLRIVLENLIRNAYDAMPDGGELTVTVEVRRPYVDIHVADTGTGIESERLQRVMDPFYSTKSRGVGLGLAMAKALTEKNNGRISVRSEVGKGTTFTVGLKSPSS